MPILPDPPPGAQQGRPKRKRPPIPKSVRAAVYSRDPYHCAQCGWKPGDPTRRPSSRPHHKGLPFWWLELDHIIPWSKGGRSVPENLQILCTGCNARKGARV